MLFDDYVLRQVQKIAELVAAIAESGRGHGIEGLDEQVAEAYRSLTGMDGELVDTLTASTLARMIRERDQLKALVELVTAHGDLCAHRGDDEAARRRWHRALALLDEIGGEDVARAALSERLG